MSLVLRWRDSLARFFASWFSSNFSDSESRDFNSSYELEELSSEEKAAFFPVALLPPKTKEFCFSNEEDLTLFPMV